MNFDEAMTMLRLGYAVARPTFMEPDHYGPIYLIQLECHALSPMHSTHIERRTLPGVWSDKDGEFLEYVAEPADLVAADWYIAAMEAPKVEKKDV